MGIGYILKKNKLQVLFLTFYKIFFISDKNQYIILLKERIICPLQ